LGYLLEALVQKDPFLNLCSHTGFKHIFGDSKKKDVIRRFSKNQHKIMFLSSIGIEKSQSCKKLDYYEIADYLQELFSR
jgi:hypothetical protein